MATAYINLVVRVTNAVATDAYITITSEPHDTLTKLPRDVVAALSSEEGPTFAIAAVKARAWVNSPSGRFATGGLPLR